MPGRRGPFSIDSVGFAPAKAKGIEVLNFMTDQVSGVMPAVAMSGLDRLVAIPQ